MTLILSGTDGLSDIDGSAATPAIRGADANTGIFFPAADTIAVATGGTQALTLNSNGALVLRGGSTSASGVGITFPATQSASSDANTLDDYEEGTFTPTIIGSITNPVLSYSQQTGKYVKIGNRIFFNILIVVSSVTSQGTGGIIISGLPFSEDGSNYEYVCPIGYNDVFDTAFPSGYVMGTQIVVIPSGVTQSNAQWGTPANSSTSSLTSGYLSISGFYNT